MYEKYASTFGVFGLGRVHFAKFSLSPSFSYTFPYKGDVVYPTIRARRSTVTLCLLYTFFFRVSLFGGVFTVFLHIWSIPCMLIIGLGFIYLLFLVSDRTF